MFGKDKIFWSLPLSVAMLANLTFATHALAAPMCKDVYIEGMALKTSQRSPEQAWNESVAALQQINKAVYGRENVIEAVATAILAKEFIWINGEPGGAKTFLSRMMFQSVLNSIPESDKKIFLLQFHKMVTEGKITGFPKFSSMMKNGKYEIETESSLVGDKFLFFIADEAEKSNTATLNALLSVLNERKAFLGTKVVDAILSSGVFTSNKTTGEFIQSFINDGPSGEALLDRMAIKAHMPNQQMTARETVAMYDMVKNGDQLHVSLPLGDLNSLVNKVQIPDQMMAEIVSLAREFDRYVTDKMNKSRAAYRYGEIPSSYFPANQFSNRSVRRMVQVFKASLITKQLMEGKSFDQIRLKANSQDLALLSQSAAYVAPAGIELKTYDLGLEYPVMSAAGTRAQMHASYSPYDGTVILKDGSGKTQFILGMNKTSATVQFQSADFAGWSVDAAPKELNKAIKKITEENQIDLNKPQFEISSEIDRLLAKGTVKERTRGELESIKEDLNHFAETLNQHFSKAEKPAVPSLEKLLPPRSEKEKREFRREMLSASQEVRISRYYDWMVYEVKAIKQRFIELDYSIEAHLTGLLSGNHLYVFGPPGGAKTALAEVILKSELKKINADQVDAFVQKMVKAVGKDQNFLKAALQRLRVEHPQQFDRFLLQFHKQLPEGVLIGFPKVEKQLNEGIEEIDVSTSLANQKFLFAILDETDKANPQTLTSLLSILNEREVFVGNQLIKTALKTAIMTSNKMQSEMLDSYNEDRSSAEAFMDRAPNKVFVSNKISSEENLTRFLMNLEKGISPNWKGLLGVGELEPLVKQVDFENPAVKEILATIHEKFLAKRLKREEDTKKAHEMDPREFPDYYVSAAGSASDRTVIKLFDQLKARFIIHQLMNGVPFKDLRTTIEMKDLGLFFEGLGYWAPQKITATYSADGILHFTNDSEVIERLMSSGIVDDRVKFHLKEMEGEARDYADVLNTVIGDFMREYRDVIKQYPDLFPSLFNQEAARNAL